MAAPLGPGATPQIPLFGGRSAASLSAARGASLCP
ncbi:unnamed protein product [Gulo gulo]|uniref:Uncharacterized protein n=1 Tax=Gulo gulo TaxID=48420 RepID=A0A9X9LUZ7_GULGU|nr:unnamed protein product [Gulo gulo]